MLIATLFSFLVGLAVMLFAANVFLNISKELSIKWKFSPLIISLVIVALGTNLPELTVTIASLANGDVGLAMGNVVGSSIANLTIILGTATLFGAVRIGTTKTPKNANILLAITFLFAVLHLSAVKIEYQIVLLLLAVVGSLIYQYRLALHGRLFEDKKALALLEKVTKNKQYKSRLSYAVLFIGSVLGISIGGRITVGAVQDLAQILQLSTTFLGLTLTGIATSLPELLLSLIASKNDDNKVVIGTLIGSNIFNLTLFPAMILASTYSMPIKKVISIKEVFFLLLVTAIFYVFLRRKVGTTFPLKYSLALISLFPLFTVFIYYF